MKALIILTALLFSVTSLAGSVGNGSFESYTTSTTYTELTGVKSAYEAGEGTNKMLDGLNYRNEEYVRDDYSLTDIDGNSYTTRYTQTMGSNQGMIGHSVTESESYTDGYVDTVTHIDDAVTGTYEEFSIGAGGINYENGIFENLENTQSMSYQDYETDTYSNSSTAYTSW